MEPNPNPLQTPPQSDDVEPTTEPGLQSDQSYFNEEMFAQPEQESELPTTESVSEPATAFVANTDTNPLQNENDNSAITSPSTPPPVDTNDVTSTTPVDGVASVTAVPAPKKKSRLWLWITIGAVLLIIGGLLASFFVVKNAGDAAARTYTADAKSYLSSVYDAATSPAPDPIAIKKAVEAVKAPVLESTFLGDLSTDYKAAEKLETDVTSHVDTLTAKIDSSAKVYSFYNDYLDLYSDLRTLDSKGVVAVASGSKPLVAAYLASFRNKLKDIKELTADASVPSDLQADVKKIGVVYEGMYIHWSDMLAAFNSDDKADYSAAYAKYLKALDGLSDARRPVTSYFNSLASKTRDAVKEFQTYSNTVK